MKESYIKLPNITVSKLQDVVDYLDENNIEYIEDYKEEVELDKYKKEIEYEQHCNEQLRNKITNLEYKIKRLEEDNKYKQVIDKIKEYIKRKNLETREVTNGNIKYILEILEEIE